MESVAQATGSTWNSQVGARAAEIKNLKVLKAPEEGGSKKDFEEFLEIIAKHTVINWDGGKDIGFLILKAENPKIDIPKELSDEDSKSALKLTLWQLEVNKYSKRVGTLEENKSAAFALIVSKISKITKSKLKSNAEYLEKELESDVLWLIESLDEVMVNFEDAKPNEIAMEEQMERILKLKQSENVPNEDFIKLVQKEIKVYEKHGGRFMWGDRQDEELNKALKKELEEYKKKEGKEMNKQENKETSNRIKKRIQDKLVAFAIIRRSCSKRYKGLQLKLQNDFLMGRNEYPTNIPDVLKILNNYKSEYPTSTRASEQSARITRNNNVNQNLSISQTNGNQIQVMYLRGTNRSFFPDITCRRCNVRGHYQTHCPIATNERGTMMPNQNNTPSSATNTNEASPVETTSTPNEGSSTANNVSNEEVSHQRAIGLSQNHLDAYINPNWILLDSESSEHIFMNKNLLEDVETTTDGEVLKLFSNGGSIDTNQKGKFGNLTVWYNPHSLANILSLALVTEQYRVTLDTGVDNAFIVHISDQHNIKFERHTSGLYFFDTSNIDIRKLKQAFIFLNTVSNKKSKYGKRDIRKADEANVLSRRINHVVKDKFVRLVKDNWIRNLPFTVGDVHRSYTIYGPSIPSIKGRTKYREAKRIPDAAEEVLIPRDVYEDMKHVTLCVDFHYVNGVTVFHSISRKIGYRTVSFPTNRSAGSILESLKDIFKVYNARGFKIIEVHADNEFDKIEKDILPVRLRTVGVDEHVPEIERSIQTQKNENRAVCHAMPYKCLPRVMIRELVAQGNAFLNAFGNKEISERGMSPRNIIDNLPHVDYNDLKYEFGQYVQLHITQKFTNNMKSRTIGAIVLGPNNIRGNYNYMSLETGAKINGRVVAELPITDEVIHRVEELGVEQGQPYRKSKMLQYEWRPGFAIDEDDAALNIASSSSDNLIISPIINQLESQHKFLNNVEYNSHQGASERISDGSQWSTSVYGDHERYEAEDQGANQGANQNKRGKAQGARSNVANQGAQYEESNAQEEAKEELINEESESEEDYTEIEEFNSHDEELESEDEYAEAIESEVVSEFKSAENKESKNNTAITTEEESHFESEQGVTESGIQRSDNEETDDDDSIEERRNVEKERREAHFKQYVGEPYGRGKRVKKPNKSYSFLQTEFKYLSEEERESFLNHAWNEYKISGKTNMLERYTTGVVFAQMSARKGIEKYKQEAEQKLLAEFKQLLEYKTFHGVKETNLTKEQKRKAGNMINLIEEKINRGHTPENPILKGRSCFNGRVQRGLYTKEQTASPTVSQDAFFLTSMIDAIEGRKVAITDVKGAYLNARMKDEVIMKIIGPEVDLFCKLDPTLKSFVTKEKGRKVLYTQLDKALYGCVQSALLWYELYSNTLLEMGFKLNPYDLCVANSNIKGKQCTICWYVDDNKISHEDPKVIEEVIKKIEDKFGSMSKTIGNEHDFLGMNIKYKNKKIEITMKKHILKAINEFMDGITRNATTPAKAYLFEVRESAKLDEPRAENFHSVVALLLFISRRCRLDIQTAVAFLTTRVSEPTEDDWRKLTRVLQYLRGTLDLKLTLGVDDIMMTKSWIDVSYGVHNDCR